MWRQPVSASDASNSLPSASYETPALSITKCGELDAQLEQMPGAALPQGSAEYGGKGCDRANSDIARRGNKNCNPGMIRCRGSEP